MPRKTFTKTLTCEVPFILLSYLNTSMHDATHITTALWGLKTKLSWDLLDIGQTTWKGLFQSKSQINLQTFYWRKE